MSSGAHGLQDNNLIREADPTKNDSKEGLGKVMGNSADDKGEDVIDEDCTNGEIAFTEEEKNEERRHFLKITATYKGYKTHYLKKLVSTEKYLDSLPQRQKSLLRNYRQHLGSIHDCITANQQIFDLIAEDNFNIFENQDNGQLSYAWNEMKSQFPTPTLLDYDKLNSVLKQISRDWSVEGEKERDSCYRPIIEEVERRYCHLKNERDIRILVPGAGLGRLSHEIVRRGYVVEGNDFSMFMLFASHFILNKCPGKLLHTCHPFISQTTNVFNHQDQIRPVRFPDIDPGDLPQNTRYSMTAGDFVQVYSTPSNAAAWDSILTCFFIDCASNIVTFIELIYKCLKPGGTWINLGPLLYHFADLPEEKSIEPSLDFVLEIVRGVGFVIERYCSNIPTQYAENHLSMLNYTYKSVFLVCLKPK